MMHSVNWPNDTCVGWMIKTMVPVRWGDIYYRWIKPELGRLKRCLWEEVAAEANWYGNSPELVLCHSLCLLFCLSFIVASLCLLLCLVVYYVCFVPSWWLIVAFIWFLWASWQGGHPATLINYIGCRELWEQKDTRLFSLITPKEVVSRTNIRSQRWCCIVPTYNASCSECAMAVIYREKGVSLPGLAAGGRVTTAMERGWQESGMTSNNHARWKEGEESDDERVDAVDFPNHGTFERD